ncbi:benzoate 4-monooxygenase cytochrome P450 [Aspergillus californicus]
MLAVFVGDNLLFLILKGILSSIAFAFIVARWLRSQHLPDVPGPWLNKYLGISLVFYELRSRRNQKIVEWHRKYGPVVCIAPDQVSIASLEAVREIYGPHSHYDKSSYFDNFMEYDARSVFSTLSFEEHRRKRPLVASFFQASNVYAKPGVEGLLRDQVLAVIGQIERETQGTKKSSVDLYSLADWYAFDNITALVFGPVHASSATKRPCEERVILSDLKRAYAWSPFRHNFPWLFPIMKTIMSRIFRQDTRHFNAQGRLRRWAYERSQKTLRDPNLASLDCLVAHLARKLSLGQGPITETPVTEASQVSDTVRFIAAESLENVNAAEASVAATITNVAWYLSIHPYWQQRLRKELQTLPMQSDGLPSFADLDHAPILDACIKETHRLKPATTSRAERVVPKGGRALSNIYLPEKTIVSTSVIAMHSDSTIFVNARNFDPSRWMEEADESKMALLNASLMQFGYGARSCTGKAVANMEMKLLLAGLFLRFETAPGGPRATKIMMQAGDRDGVRHGLKCELECQPLSPLS